MTEALIIEDDLFFASMLSSWLSKRGMSVTTVSSVSEARNKLKTATYQFILSDLYLPDGEGIDVLTWLRKKDKNVPFIIMTNFAQIPTAVQAIKLGASDYIAKPINQESLWTKITELLHAASKADQSSTGRIELIEGTSALSKQMYELINLVAPTNMSVLISGTSGTGKEFAARRIHELSERSKAPFIAVDCGAIPKELASSEFFGHVKGSFTGAIDNKIGAFEAARGGTIFLDEIGNLTYEIQVQLLRALQEHAIKPIGTNKLIKTDVRLISATNENLRTAIAAGHFREDLYHRINEFNIRIPDLKERPEDILLFAEHFLRQSNIELKKEVKGFNKETAAYFFAYPWPGNLRQMRNAVRYATLLATDDYIAMKDLPQELTISSVANSPTQLKSEAHERELIVNALQRANNNKTLAARLLGIDRKTLYNKIKAYNLEI
ncbi:MAG: sigma-54 dependent transcriptional regulator [Tannerellaceae bacterium]|jgi:two-component system response regulator HydG|nr:sigma-54 dependent transcriptional regulator [Tannerellaceae bacterium]